MALFRWILAFGLAAALAAVDPAAAQQAPQAEVHDDSQLPDAVVDPRVGERAGLPEGAPHGDPHAAGAHAAGAHGGDAHGGGHGESHGNTDPLSVDPDLAIFTWIVFVILLLVLRKFAWGPIARSLEKREQAIADQLAAAKVAHEEGKARLALYEQKLAQAQVEVRAILDEARREAEHGRQEVVAAARADARAERDRAVREIELAADQALQELSAKSTDLAVELAGRIAKKKISAADHSQLIAETMSRFGPGGAGHSRN
jgi:F-type H+-transporting ATPase subunit b